MPYAQQHYPFENKEYFEQNFPANFIAEGLDQTRGWFYTLVVLGAALFDKPPAKNVIVNGLILAEDGQKMSKRKKNYPDPTLILNKYGADALRLFLLSSPVVRGEDLKFSEAAVKDTLRKVMLPIWNSYSFFITYANVDNWEPKNGDIPTNLSNPLDRWILSSLTQMIEEVTEEMDHYRLQKAAIRFEQFVDDLTNWYIRRSRRRFWKSQNDNDKNEAYQTLYYVLLTFTKTAAPFIPFITESIYQNLRTNDMPKSVHLTDFPVASQAIRDVRLETQMDYTMRAVSLGRFLRTQHSLKVRQPLAKAIIVITDTNVIDMLKETSPIIAEELNVKEVVFQTNEADLVTRSAKANFKALGPKLGKEMKDAATQIATFDDCTIASILKGEAKKITLSSGNSIDITEEFLIIQRTEKEGLTVATEEGITIALDTELTNELEQEGFARELVSKLQNARKEMDLQVTDRIELSCVLPQEFEDAVVTFNDYICNETLCTSLVVNGEDKGYTYKEVTQINGVDCTLNLKKH
jgi:isoleucyl-tRNA synthetase